jgi:putative 4-hydroxybenzoate polyprenyltransferase
MDFIKKPKMNVTIRPNLFRQFGMILDAVIFRHTLFSLPFAAMALLLETGARPPLAKTLLILLAVVAGRNAANAFNRVIDADIDARNPRIADRHIPQRLISQKTMLSFGVLLCVVLALAAFLLNPLCVALLPLAGALIVGYSFSKRFTLLCHYWLGLACSCSVMGTFIGLSGHFALRYFVLAASHALWVAGFDIIYAMQDVDFDRKEKLHSIPAKFGLKWAKILAILSHLGTLAGLLLVPFFWQISPWYFVGVGVTALLLGAEHTAILGYQGKGEDPEEAHRIRLASYSLNEILPLALLAGTALGLFTLSSSGSMQDYLPASLPWLVKGQREASAKAPLRVGIMPDADSLPFMVARDEGFFAAEGVSVELVNFQSPQERDAAIQAGQLDGSISDLLASAFFAAGGFDFKITSLTDGRYGIVGSAALGIGKLGDLRGKRVGLSTNTIIQYTVDAQLEAVGIPADAYEAVSIPRMPLRLEMIRNGQIEAVSLPEPLLTAAVGQGGVLLSTTDDTGIDAGVLLFSKKTLDRRFDEVSGFYRAYYRAAQKINAGVDDYRDYLVEKAAFPAEVGKAYRFVHYRRPGLPGTDQIERALGWLKARNLLNADIKAEDLIDGRIEAAAAAW